MTDSATPPHTTDLHHTPVAWHTIVHNPGDIDAGLAVDGPLFLDLLSNRTYTATITPQGRPTLAKGPTESIQRFVPDSFLASNGWMGVVGASTVLARGFVDGWVRVLHADVDPLQHPSPQQALPSHWSDFQRRFGLAIGPRCVVLTRSKEHLFQPHLPFAGVQGPLAHTALGCIFQELGSSAHEALSLRQAADTWAEGLNAFWAASVEESVPDRGDESATTNVSSNKPQRGTVQRQNHQSR